MTEKGDRARILDWNQEGLTNAFKGIAKPDNRF
jgi:hypothetical protein